MADDAHYLAALKKELIAAPERKIDIQKEIDRVQPVVDSLVEAKAERAAAVAEAKAAEVAAAVVPEPAPEPVAPPKPVAADLPAPPAKKVAKSRKAAK